MLPGLEEVRELLEGGSYKRIPVKRELFADSFTPIEIMRALREVSDHVFLLESAENDQRWGRYTFLGYAPTAEITCTDGRLTVRRGFDTGAISTETCDVDHPRDFLRGLVSDYRSPILEGFPPFCGGLVGYFSFDYLKYAEPTLRGKDLGEDDFLDLDLMLFDRLICIDTWRQRVILMCGVMGPDVEESYKAAERTLDEMEDTIRHGRRKEFEPLHLERPLEARYTRERFKEMVNAAKDHIREGDIFQVVLSNPLTAPATGSLFDSYRYLRSENPSPYMFYFSSDDQEISGASPETLVKLTAGKLFTYPLAGTRPRGSTETEDRALSEELLADEKELAEHNMLVDLGRNDLGRIAQAGTVKVEHYLEVLRFSHVMHLGSTVTAQIREGLDAFDAIDSVLPAGTLSGAPKLSAINIIGELEATRRGIYGGALGYVDFSGNLDVCIGIRLAYKKAGQVSVRSGAGIVADSDPQKEYEECQNKARAQVRALEAAAEGVLR